MSSWFKKARKKFIEIVAPKHEVPITRWTADNLWDISWVRVVLITLGIIFLGIGGSFTVQSGLGTAPWTVLAQGISVQTGLALGVSFFLISLSLFLMWIPLSLKPGYGTIANTIFFAFGLQIGVDYIPHPANTFMAYVLVLTGVFITGAGGALYITCGLGTGPRDGIMLAFTGKTKMPFTVVRAVIEILVLTVGYFLGGDVGIGTLIIALLIGRSFSFWFDFFARFPPKANPLKP
ncbi:MAG: hypothetical protein WCN84_01190 [Actinomycetes bacterium]|jgi:uncharacterized membrane protein YczE